MPTVKASARRRLTAPGALTRDSIRTGSVARSVSLVLALLLAACAETPPSPTPEAPPTSEIATPRSTAPQRTIAPPTRALETPPPIDSILPRTLGGVELHTFAVGQDILERLAARLAVDIERFEVRFASEHGARFLQMYALRLSGTSGAQLVDAWVAVAYPPDVEDATSEEQSMGGTTVVVVSAPSAESRIGTFHVYSSGDTLIAVQAFDQDVAAEALAALP